MRYGAGRYCVAAFHFMQILTYIAVFACGVVAGAWLAEWLAQERFNAELPTSTDIDSDGRAVVRLQIVHYPKVAGNNVMFDCCNDWYLLKDDDTVLVAGSLQHCEYWKAKLEACNN